MADCGVPVSEAVWMLFSMTLYSANLFYLTMSRIAENYDRNKGIFPHHYVVFQRIWLLSTAASLILAYTAYMVAGGWQSTTSATLSTMLLFLLIEAVRSGWAILLFRFGVIGWTLLLIVCTLCLRLYLVVLYGLLQTPIAVLYIPVLGSNLVELIQCAWTLRRLHQPQEVVVVVDTEVPADTSCLE